MPVALAARLRRSHFLFIGYEMVDWNLRLVMQRVWGDRPVAYRSWAVDSAPTALESAFWRRFQIDVLDVEPDAYVELLARRLEGVRDSHRHLALSGSRTLRRFRARRGLLLRPRARHRDRCGQSDCVALDRAYGPSGVGKSSLLLAAVARKLRDLPEEPVVVVFANWSDQPEHGLAAAIGESAGIDDGELLDVVARVQQARDVYVILDQAEEYFTYHGDEGAFESSLAELVNRPQCVNVLLSLREDTLASAGPAQGRIPNLFGNVLRLDRLDRAPGRAAIVRPLERWTELEGERSTLRTRSSSVSSTVSAPGGSSSDREARSGRAERSPRGIEAPYLQLVMQRLWDVERAAGSTTLRAETLDALGGAGQIVADHLERAIDALTPAATDIAARLFEHLVTPSGTKIAHQASDLAKLAGAAEGEVQPVVTTLARHRILRTDESGRWEIFHDVLAGATLAWTNRYAAERAIEAERRRRRRAIQVAGAILATAVILAAITVFAVAQRERARTEARDAEARRLDAASAAVLPTDPELGLLLASESARLSPGPTSEEALRNALLASTVREKLSLGEPVRETAISPDGRLVGAVGSDGLLRIWDLSSGDLRVQHRVGPDGGLSFTRRGTVLAHGAAGPPRGART